MRFIAVASASWASGAQRAQRHTRRIKAAHDGFDGLYLVEVYRLRPGNGMQQVAKRRHGPVVYQLRVALVVRCITAGNGLLQGHHHVRVEGVIFLAVYILEQAALLKTLRWLQAFCARIS